MANYCLVVFFWCILQFCFALRLVYDISRCFVQFVLPLLVVLGVYISIFCRLKDRPVSQHSENNRRRRRTNIMIISVSLVFFLSWLPLNTLNFLLDFKSNYIQVSVSDKYSMNHQKRNYTEWTTQYSMSLKNCNITEWAIATCCIFGCWWFMYIMYLKATQWVRLNLIM